MDDGYGDIPRAPLFPYVLMTVFPVSSVDREHLWMAQKENACGLTAGIVVYLWCCPAPSVGCLKLTEEAHVVLGEEAQVGHIIFQIGYSFDA